MSGKEITIEVTERKALGKGLQALRAEGSVPVVLHNHGEASMHLQADYTKLKKMYDEAGKHHPVFMTVAGKRYMALVKDADFEPTKNRLRHVVFQAIRQGEKTTAEIPIVFAEDVEIPAERAGLLVLRSLDSVEVEALPKDLPDRLVIDPSTLTEVGDTLTVADLKAPSGVVILTDAEHGLVSVEMPKDQAAEADAAAAELSEDADSVADVPAEQGAADAEDAETKATEGEASQEKPSEG